MASTKFLIVAAVLVAGAQAKFVWQDDNFPSNNPYKIQMPVPPTPPRLPFAPFQPFQPFQPSQLFQPFAPFKPFPPSFINVQPPRMLTPDDIRNANPGPNQVYNGVMVSSSSNIFRDKDGNLVKQGGTHVIANQDGNVHEYKHGNAPPDLNNPIKVGQPW